MGLPVGAEDVLPSLMLIRRGTAGEEVPGDTCAHAFFHGFGDILVLEDEEERRRKEAAHSLLHGVYSAVLEDEFAELGDERHQAHGDDPLRGEGGAEGGELAWTKASKVEEDEEDHIHLNGEIHQEVTGVESHRGKVEGHRVHNADALAKQVVVSGSHDGDASSGDLGEEIGCSIEGGLSTLFELEGIDVRRGFFSQSDVVAGEDIFGQIHHWGTLTHTTTIPGPEAVEEIGMAVVHSNAQTRQETLVDGAEGPFCSCVALAYSSLASSVDELSETKVSAAGSGTVFLVQGDEHAQHIGNLESFADEGAHVTIEGLHIVTGCKSQAVQLIACLTLSPVLALTETEGELPGQDLENAEATTMFVPHTLDTRLLESSVGVVAAGCEVVIHHLPQVRSGPLLKVKDEVQGIIGIGFEQESDGLIVQGVSLGVTVGLMRQDDLSVVFGKSLLGVLAVVLLDLRQGRESAAVLKSSDHGLGHGLTAHGGPHADLDHADVAQALAHEVVVQLLGL
mmetsp:Transcript_35841/g.76462  ORF Transcript_35841/g.76462 Transcript_35841/m.76462 type:complete len:509 (-) Transcript_35841:556-2082(-)